MPGLDSRADRAPMRRRSSTTWTRRSTGSASTPTAPAGSRQNFITEDTEALDARATQAIADAASRFAKEAVRFDKVEVPADQRRQLNLLKVSLVLATPADPKEAEELTEARVVDARRVRQGQVVSGSGQARLRA